MDITELIQELDALGDEVGHETEVRLVVDYQTGNNWPIVDIEYDPDGDGCVDLLPDFN